MDSKLDTESKSRREFVRRAVYITPAILTLAAAPAYAKSGSLKSCPPGQVGNANSKSKNWEGC